MWCDVQDNVPSAKLNAQEKRSAVASSSPVDTKELDASSSDLPKPTEVGSTGAMEKGDGTEKTAQESAIEDAIRLTRSRLRKRMGSIGNGTDSGPDTPK